MYNALIKRLVDFAAETRRDEDAEIAFQAADAIEELSAYVRQIEELRKEGYYLQKTKMMTYGQATMTMPLPELPKEE